MRHSKLSEHKFKKGKFIAPLNEFMTPISNNDTWCFGRLPEYIWIGLILNEYGRRNGMEKIYTIIKKLNSIDSTVVAPRLSEILSMNNDKQEEFYDYVSHEIIDNTIYIYVISNRNKYTCPYCGQDSSKVHSKYIRKFQDLPIQNKKVEIILTNKKYFCNNIKCSRRTFAESFDCFQFKGKKTIRLEEQISKIAINMSSIAAQNYLRENIANVSKSTICTLLKKRYINENK